ncbi:DUF1028 domain-containing protein [Amphibacillus cookii]|uniref:DUF1028 domain-containing protein n=1 Tax=Amphibacillus cookii TaxID=767787 RepID=UPI00195731FE|nr:DUF1028 domain-containing protein [Amphibacillus cookii]MBM7539885.1 putative Ntn-hydrolase superfamily protein [Amphibacillus cookii]
MTFSIVGYDPETKELGVAVASKFLGVGSVVPFAKAGVGAVASQSLGNPVYGIDGLALLEKGKTVEEVLQTIIDQDKESDWRQVGIVDRVGHSMTYTGANCYDWAGGVAGANFAIQGNILVDEHTVKAMHATFLKTRGDLATRLIKSLRTGDLAGGDRRGKQSAALLIVKEGAGYGETDRYIDLRVDDHIDPIPELQRLLDLHYLYFKPTDPDDILKIEGELEQELINQLERLGYYDRNSTDLVTALQKFQYIENFDERVQQPGYVDRKVVEFLEQLVQDG